jgi:hypothetical protein
MPSVRFAPTGVGSLPFAEFSAAAAHVSSCYPERPFYPEPPAERPEEGVVARLWPAEVRAKMQSGEVVVRGNPGDVGEVLAAADLSRLPFLADFSARVAQLPGPRLFVHLAGPVSFLRASRCTEAAGTLWDHPRLREKAAAYVGAIGARLARECAAAGREAVVVFDEPFYAAPVVDVDNPANLLLLSTALSAVDAAGARGGFHSCGEPPLDVLLHLDYAVAFFDAHGYGPSLLKRRRTLERFLKRGGELALGVFSPAAADDDLDAAIRLLAALPVGDGTGILLSAACGTGAVAPERELRVARNLAALRTRLLGGDQ